MPSTTCSLFSKTSLFLAITLFSIGLSTAIKAEDAKSKIEWRFAKAEANPLHSLAHAALNNEVRITRKANDNPNLTIEIFIGTSLGKNLIYTMKCHDKTVFVSRDNRLYWAKFSQIATGCEIIAVDLKTGQEFWKTELKGLAVVHSEYWNSVNLALSDQGLVIFGHEAAGKYIERLNLKTGKRNYHQVVK